MEISDQRTDQKSYWNCADSQDTSRYLTLRLRQSQEPWQIPLSKSIGSAQSEPEKNQSLQGIQKTHTTSVGVAVCSIHRGIFWASVRDEMPEGPQGEALVITKCGDVDWPGRKGIAVDIMISSRIEKHSKHQSEKIGEGMPFLCLKPIRATEWPIFGCNFQPGLFREITGKRLLFDGGLSKGFTTGVRFTCFNFQITRIPWIMNHHPSTHPPFMYPFCKYQHIT